MTKQVPSTQDAAGKGGEPSRLGAGVRKVRKWLVKTFVLLMTSVVIVFALWTWIALSYTYSNGERAGYVQKLSKKGWIFKTWEGELAMANLPGAMPQIFYFSIREDKVAEQLQASLGRRVRIMYDEHVGVPVNWFGETPYFIVGMEIVDDAEIPK